MNRLIQNNLSNTFSFNNRFTRELPADPELSNRRRQVHSACYSRVAPTRTRKPQLIAYSQEMQIELGLSDEMIHTQQFTDVFSGNDLLNGMDPYAMCYGGHQFGNWAGQLGDGRAINLGEIISQKGETLALQLKGAGPTPYSRSADGLAVLRSSVREFLCSEAMFHLGVPTTRALSLALTGDEVMRDMFYDGHPAYEPGAVVCRVAPNFIRLGSFEIFASLGDKQTLQQLVDFTIKHFFPEIEKSGPDAVIAFFRAVCRRTAELIVHWQRVGFVHGVMNTDNLSVLGLTIDYGPYGWLEDFDPGWTPNTTDAGGKRYCYGKQPEIAHWNLVQFANALYPLVEQVEPFKEILSEYGELFNSGWQKMLASKLGLSQLNSKGGGQLLDDLTELLQIRETDMTLFFRSLAELKFSKTKVSFDETFQPLLNSLYQSEETDADYQSKAQDWLEQYRHHIDNDKLSASERIELMNSNNPLYVLRNYLAQEAIDIAEKGDYSRITEQLEVLRNPYQEQPGKQHFAGKRPEWARHRAGCSMLSCSS